MGEGKEALKSRVVIGFKYLFIVWGVIPGSLAVLGLIYKLSEHIFNGSEDLTLAVMLTLPFILGLIRGGKPNAQS